MHRDATITMPRVLHKRLKKIADDRDSSMNILVNTALAHWLAKKRCVAVEIRMGELLLSVNEGSQKAFHQLNADLFLIGTGTPSTSIVVKDVPKSSGSY